MCSERSIPCINLWYGTFLIQLIQNAVGCSSARHCVRSVSVLQEEATQDPCPIVPYESLFGLSAVCSQLIVSHRDWYFLQAAQHTPSDRLTHGGHVIRHFDHFAFHFSSFLCSIRSLMDRNDWVECGLKTIRERHISHILCHMIMLLNMNIPTKTNDTPCCAHRCY